MQRYLYLPIEVAARELDSKLLLAHFAIRRGFDVVLGQKWLMQENLANMPPGHVVFKTMTRVDQQWMEKARAFGHRVFAIDEEMAGISNCTTGLRWVSRDAAGLCDAVFCNGEEHANALAAAHPNLSKKFVTTGSLRWDLLRPELRDFYADEAAAIRRRYGPFVLINTNNAFVNSARSNRHYGIVWGLVRRGKLNPFDPRDIAFVLRRLHFDRTNWHGIKNLLRLLPKEFPRYRFIVRPHPTERVSTWQRFVEGLSGVFVASSGPAVPWIMAAEALVHTSCTTGAEAFALGTPAISFQPSDSPVAANYVSNLVNIVAEDAAQVCSALRRLSRLENRATFYQTAHLKQFDRFFASRSGSLAAERMIDMIADPGRDGCISARGESASWRPLDGYLQGGNATNYRERIMSGIEPEGARRKLERIARQLGHDANLAIRTCGDHTICISEVSAPGPTASRLQPEG
jgi:surface carbohydrate biosynthesis protein